MSTVAAGDKYKHRSTGAVVRVTKVEDIEGRPVVFYRFQKKSESKLEQRMRLTLQSSYSISNEQGFIEMFKPA